MEKYANTIPLSQFQRQILVYQLMNTTSIKYNIIKIFEVDIKFNIDLLQQAHYKILEQHEILRTFFISTQDDFYQEVMPLGISEIIVIDSNPKASPVEEMKNLLEKSYSVFTLPLHRIAITTGEKNLIGISFHHSIADGETTLRFLEQLFCIYFNLERNTPLFEKNSVLQYRDYVNYERKIMATWEKPVTKFWETLLKNYTTPQLSPKVINEEEQKENRYLMRLDKKMLTDISIHYKQASSFNVILTIFHLMIMYNLKLTDLVIGTVVSSRKNFLGESKTTTFGAMVTTVPIRLKLDKNDTIESALNKTRKNYYDYLKKYAGYQFSNINSKNKLLPHKIGMPIFDIVMVYDKTENINIKHCNLSYIITSNRYSPYPMLLTVKIIKDKYFLIFDYNHSLFSHDFIKKVANNIFMTINIMATKNTPVGLSINKLNSYIMKGEKIGQ